MKRKFLSLLFVYIVFYTSGIFAAAICQINSVSTLNFGEINNVDDLPDVTTATIEVSCNGGSGTYTLSFNAGHSNDMLHRTLIHTNETDTMLYNFYKNPDYTGVLGDGTGNTVTISNSFVDNQTDDITIYGRIMPQPTSIPGNYSEDPTGIVVTLTY